MNVYAESAGLREKEFAELRTTRLITFCVHATLPMIEQLMPGKNTAYHQALTHKWKPAAQIQGLLRNIRRLHIALAELFLWDFPSKDLNQSSLEEHHAHRKTCNQHVKGGDAADDEAMRQNFQRVWVLEDLFRPPAEQNQVLGMMSFKCPEFLSVPSLAANLSIIPCVSRLLSRPCHAIQTVW